MRDQEGTSDPAFRNEGAATGSLQRWLPALDAVDDGIYRLDAEGRVTAVNDAVVETTGYAREELLGEPVSILVEERDARRLEREIRARLESGSDPNTAFNLAIETADGERVPCELRFSLLLVDGAFEGTAGVVRPIDETDRTNDQLPSIWETYESISSVIDEADVGVFVLDDAFDVVWIDETIETYFGIERAAVVGRDKRTLIRESIGERFADPETFAETVLATYDDNTYVEQFECQITAGEDREERWLEHRSKPITSGRYAGGRVELYYDVTDRKEAERARRESERRLQREHDLTEQLLEASPVGIAVVNPDGSTARTNRRMVELLDLSPDGEESYTSGQRDMYDADGDVIPVEARPVSRVFETGEAVTDREVLLRRSDGRRQWLSINARPITDEEGEPEQVVETATDVTDLKELAERRKRDLEEREKELAAVRLATGLLESGEQPVDQLVREFVTALPQFFRHPERTDARLTIGTHEAATEGYEPLDRRITARSSTVNGTPIAIDVVHGEEVDRSDGERAFLPEEQELIETLATLLKLHFDRREYIADLRNSNERLEQFAYAASHDLQEPLRMVSSYLQLIERRYEDALDEDGEEFLEYAIDGAERMRTMIDGLLQYSRVESRGDPFERVDLDDVLADVLSDLRLSIDEQDADVAAEPLPVVEGDASQLRQVFQNLLENAIEYSGDDPPTVRVSAERSGSEVIVSVRDEGIGIDAADQERIFEVFQRLHTSDEHAGTGIGLALCRRIVERHGGDLRVDSEPGEGTTFSFTLPLADE